MNTRRLFTLTAAILCITVPGATFATNQFPDARHNPAGCDDMGWPKDLVAEYPKLVNACQEVVLAEDGNNWARFNGQFESIDRDGRLTFAIQDSNNRYVEDVYLTPSTGQVAYIDGRETPFNRLQRGQMLNLYLPEGQSGFSTKAGVPLTTIATIEPKKTDNGTIVLRNNMPAFDHVHFTLGSAVLTAETKRALDEQARLLKNNPNVTVSVSGHTSASATQSFNQALSERRAQAVRDYLVTAGRVEGSRLTTIGYGEMQPLEYEAKPTDLNSSQALANMRVELVATRN